MELRISQMKTDCWVCDGGLDLGKVLFYCDVGWGYFWGLEEGAM